MSISAADIGSGGYGAFWIANSLTSLFLGGRNRNLQAEAQERNEAFQLELERARNITEDNRLQEEIAFKRRMHALARQYRQEELTESFEQQMKAIELTQYLNYWPLSQNQPNTFLNRDNYTQLNVILMHSQFFPKKKYCGEPDDKDAEIFNTLEYEFNNYDIPYIKDVKFWENAAVKTNGKADISGGNAAVMNIHFLMSQLPTLVIYPYYDNHKMYFNGAVWEAQAARPLMRHLFSFDFSQYDLETKDDYRTQAKALFRTAIAVIAGSVRDSYMLLTQGQDPTMPVWLNDDNHKTMKKIIRENPVIKQFVKQEYDSIVTELDSPKLLEVFKQEDIEAMKSKIKSNRLKM